MNRPDKKHYVHLFTPSSVFTYARHGQYCPRTLHSPQECDAKKRIREKTTKLFSMTHLFILDEEEVGP